MIQPRPARAERPVVDVDHLVRLESHLGRPALAELIADGLIELSDRIERLDELGRGRDLEGLARLGHDLAGMSGNLGLARLSAAAVELDRAARDGAPLAALPAAAAVRRLGLEATEALRRHLVQISRS